MKWILVIWPPLLGLIILLLFAPHGSRFVRSNAITYLPFSASHEGPLLTRTFRKPAGESIPPMEGRIWIRVPVPPEAYSWNEPPVLFTGSNELIPEMSAYLEANGGVSPLSFCELRLSSPSCRYPFLQYAFPVGHPSGSDGNARVLLSVNQHGVAVQDEFYFFPAGYFNRMSASLSLFLGLATGISFLVAALAFSLFRATRDWTYFVCGCFFFFTIFTSFLNRGAWDALKPFDSWPFGHDLLIPFYLSARVFDLAFLSLFFNLWSENRRLARAVAALIGLCATVAALAAFGMPMTLLHAHISLLAMVLSGIESGILLYLVAQRKPLAVPYFCFWNSECIAEFIWGAYHFHWVGGHWILGFLPLLVRPLQVVLLCGLVVQRMNALSLEVGYARVRAHRNSVVRTLLRVLSHDLANTTHVILFATDAALNGEDPEKVGESVERIRKAAAAQAEILKNVRKTYATRNGGELNLVPVHIANCLEKCLEIYQPQFDRKGVTVVRDFGDEDLSVIAEPTSLGNQVIANLLDNARKFTPAGGIVTVSVRAPGRESVALEIADSGIGMAHETAKGLFTEEGRSSRPGTDAETGTGTGLLVVRDFLAAYGAEISVTSGVNQGTKFRILFRRAPAAGKENAA